MAELNTTFDANTVTPNAPIATIPDGDYTVIAKESVWERTKNNDGTFLKFQFEVLEGPHKGTPLWDRLNLDNQNPQAVEIAQKTLSALCHATGVMIVKDSAQLHNIPIIATVKIKPDDKGEPRNEIKGYKKRAGAGTISGSALTGPISAAPATPAPAAPATAPWLRPKSAA